MKNNALTINQLIETFNLTPHIEGGYYNRYFRDPGIISKSALPEEITGDRNFASAIQYLMPSKCKCLLHRILYYEIWHFYAGSPFYLYQISPKGELTKIVLGKNLDKHMQFVHVVPKGYWMGGFCSEKNSFSFLGCTVAPGFDIDDWEKGDRKTLLDQYPKHQDIILKLTD